jgi:hypothetical protein
VALAPELTTHDLLTQHLVVIFPRDTPVGAPTKELE